MAKVNYIPQNWFDTNVPDTQSGYIIPGKLHPAYLGKLLDGSTSHSGSYGSIQSDGRKYYYTDIDGSRPIKDPRIGAHFGSQRHKAKSIQLLEQETATHEENVYSIDGREWMRAVKSVSVYNGGNGNWVELTAAATTTYIEVVGYFSDINVIFYSDSGRVFRTTVDGGSESSDIGTASVSSPLNNRHVDAGSVVNAGLEQTLGIHTVKIRCNGGSVLPVFGIELIAQDTTSTATRSQIQIPEQDVFAHGKKVRIPAHAEHYDPFNGFTSGSDISSYVDTTTSLGLSKWLHSGNYYRPYNGMRVVKWTGRSGIHTSVTVMPPNAKSIGNSSTLTNATAKANASISNNTFYPTFETHTTSVNEDRLHEAAKTYWYREFGNGGGKGIGTNATYADASLLDTNSADIAYVMDDGLTNLVGDDVTCTTNSGHEQISPVADGDSTIITFIGTGITCTTEVWGAGKHTFAQNLPYGTHIVKIYRDADANPDITIDGVSLPDVGIGTYGVWEEVTFHQPKMPPIPDDACIIADYMLMADFVPQTSAGINLISKGVRRQNISRDVFFNETDGDSFTFSLNISESSSGFLIVLSGNADSDTSMKLRIPSFGTNYVHRGYQSDTRTKLFIGDTDNDSSATKDNSASTGSYAHLTSNVTLGVHQFGSNAASGQNGHTGAFDIVTPIHTSHHYKSFESPFLKELIGGDRNMEQTHLICSADGKTWDDITRNKNYLSNNVCIVASRDGGDFTSAQSYKYDLFRGTFHVHEGTQKNFAIAYDRFICLVEGYYKVTTNNYTADADRQIHVLKNSVGDDNAKAIAFGRSDPPDNTITLTGNVHLKRGDFIGVYISGGTIRGNNVVYTFISIEKI